MVSLWGITVGMGLLLQLSMPELCALHIGSPTMTDSNKEFTFLHCYACLYQRWYLRREIAAAQS